MNFFPNSFPRPFYFLIQSECIPIYIVASCDPNSNVQRKGEDSMKRLKHDFEDKKVKQQFLIANFSTPIQFSQSQLVSTLFLLFLGSDAKSTPNPEDLRSPVSLVLRHKIVTFLCRSRLAANSFPQTLQVTQHL